MAMIVATRKWEHWRDCVDSWQDTARGRLNCVIVADKDVIPAYDRGYRATTEEVLGYCHDDLVIYESGWNTRILKEFEDPTVGMVGFTGALGHGTTDLYSPAGYHLPNLARQTFMSNMRDAEKHGVRFAGERDVAVCDGLGIFVYREILERVGGWKAAAPYGYWLYSEFLSCETRRQGYRIRMVGIDCLHLGGKSSQFIAKSPTYEEAHYYLWEHNRDVLPYRVPE
jgi:hypothetical protein